jgi:SAM-dependent methyltransferase
VTTREAIVEPVRKYYEAKLLQHGATPGGVDWNSDTSQRLRFEQFERLFADQRDPRIVDYGCGYGALVDYLRGRGRTWDYVGFDVSPAMIEAARQGHAGDARARFVGDRSELEPGDLVVASGIFNVRLAVSDAAWLAYMLDTIHDLASLGCGGFAFNALTSYSHRERQRPDLYYADPRVLFDFCKRTFSKRVALLHDYPLFEFTILVRMEAR